MDSSNTCNACASPCLTCKESDDTCTSKCADGFFYDSGSCSPCAVGCNTCTDAYDCTCTSGDDPCTVYDFKTGYEAAEPGDTDDCSDGYYLTAYKCEACEANCKECSDDTTCTTCNDGYFINAGSCSRCYPNCKTCSDSNPPPARGSCLADGCADGFYAHTDGTCRECDASCLTCDDGTTACTSCHDGYFVDSSASDVCTECNTECLACSAADTCTACRDGWYLDEDATPITCVRCHSSCLKCSGAGLGACTECRTGQNLSDAAGGFCSY